MTWHRKIEGAPDLEPRVLAQPPPAWMMVVQPVTVFLLLVIQLQHWAHGLWAAAVGLAVMLTSLSPFFMGRAAAGYSISFGVDGLTQRSGRKIRQLSWRDMTLLRRIGPNFSRKQQCGFEISGVDDTKLFVSVGLDRREQLIDTVLAHCRDAAGRCPLVEGPVSQPRDGFVVASSFWVPLLCLTLPPSIYLLGKLLHRW